MAKRRPAKSAGRQKTGMRRGNRAGRIAVVVMEMILIAALALGCYGVSILGTLEREEIAAEDIYSFNGENTISVKALGTPAASETAAPSKEETLAQVVQEITEPETE